jgi:dimethylhistidine N-methyltransferase
MPHSVASSVSTDRARFADEVAYYLSLSPRQLPSRYLYDSLGSALFDAICELPWYPITRAEQALLALHGREIFSRLTPLDTLVELGPGDGRKLSTLLGAAALEQHLAVHLVDVSSAALDAATRQLDTHRDVSVVRHQGDYEAGLEAVGSGARRAGRLLALFLGSNIGNFDPPGAAAFLSRIRATLMPGDGLLLGADLVKPKAEMLLAYDDPLGVTAAFNRNLLVRANRELGADFDLDGFAHEARWLAEESRIEMHLVSRRRQQVRLSDIALEITFEEGESIWTESSYKYALPDVAAMVTRAGFTVTDQWVGDGFALTLGRVR